MSENVKKIVEFAVPQGDVQEKGASYYQPPVPPADWEPPSAALVMEPAAGNEAPAPTDSGDA